jgi:hypothetical protein
MERKVLTMQEEAKTQAIRDEFIWGDTDYVSEGAIRRVLFYELEKIAGSPSDMGYELVCRIGVPTQLMIHQLERKEDRLVQQPQSKSMIILCPINIGGPLPPPPPPPSPSPSSKTNIDLTRCDQKKEETKPISCFLEKGNHWVALIIDSRPNAQQLSRDAGGKGVLTYWDPRGDRIRTPALRSALFQAYPGFLLNEVEETLQSDGWNCAIWMLLFMIQYVNYAKSSKTHFSLVELGRNGNQFDLLTRRDMESTIVWNQPTTQTIKNEEYIRKIRWIFKGDISFIWSDERFSF